MGKVKPSLPSTRAFTITRLGAVTFRNPHMTAIMTLLDQSPGDMANDSMSSIIQSDSLELSLRQPFRYFTYNVISKVMVNASMVARGGVGL